MAPVNKEKSSHAHVFMDFGLLFITIELYLID